jgi:hypothetical protein
MARKHLADLALHVGACGAEHEVDRDLRQAEFGEVVVEGRPAPSFTMPRSAFISMYSRVWACLRRISCSLRFITSTSGSAASNAPSAGWP